MWISGQSGSGKTSLGEALKQQHDFVHFDGDVFANGGVPEHFSGIPTEEMLKGGDPHVRAAYGKMVEEGFGPLLRGEPCPPLAVWAPFHDLLCADVLRVWDAHPDRSLAVSFAVYPRQVRDYVMSKLPRGATPPATVMLVLNDAAGSAVQRKFRQVETAAAAAGQSVKEFLTKFGPEWSSTPDASDEQVRVRLRAKMVETQTGFTLAGPGELGIDVIDGMSAQEVLECACRLLSLQLTI